MSISISQFRNMALEAMKSETGLDTVIHLNEGKTGLCSRKCEPLGKRSKEFKTANLDVRKTLTEALNREISGLNLNKLPKDLVKALKIGDFNLSKDGKIALSKKPLTARRILQITDALKLNSEEKASLDSLNKMNLGRTVSTFDKIQMAKLLADETIEPWQAHVICDLLVECRKKISLPRSGSSQDRLMGFVESFIFTVAPKLRKVETSISDNRAQQYGKHEFGAQDRSNIILGIFTTLVAKEPMIRDCIQQVDLDWLKTAFEKHTVEVDGRREYLLDCEHQWNESVHNKKPNPLFKKQLDQAVSNYDLAFVEKHLYGLMQSMAQESPASS